MLKHEPLVSIVTPVFNGELYLRECIESALAQTYTNFEYIIANNCSNDSSLRIAKQYARKDHRIKIHNNEKFVGAVENSNNALRLLSPKSKYCKILHADDWLYPECLEKMVSLAEQFPSVGVVSAYRLKDTKVVGDGLPYTDIVVSGKEICRSRLLGGPYLFGSPSSTMLRSDIVRARNRFYCESMVHVDVEVMFEILKELDFGFIHQVLTFTRIHEKSRATTIVERFNTNRLEGLGILKRHGPIYLTSEEYTERFNFRLGDFYIKLTRKPSQLFNKDFRKRQQEGLKKVGFNFNILRLFNAFFYLAARYFAKPFSRIFGLFYSKAERNR